ncbi:MAG: hypothetical protein ACREUX_24605 [Burkholderiales bacterium]
MALRRAGIPFLQKIGEGNPLSWKPSANPKPRFRFIVTADSDRRPKSVSFNRNRRSACFGILGHVQSEFTVTLLRNRRSASIGIRGHLGPEYAVMLSAWDKASGEGLRPSDFLRVKLPLLQQYLTTNPHQWDMRVYGVSAQGGDYDEVKAGAQPTKSAEDLRELDQPSTRIDLTDGVSRSNDLTIPLAWLLGD